MPNANDELTSEYSEKLKRIEAEMKYAERVGVEFPSSVTDDLKFVKSQYNEVVKKLADKNNEKASQKEISGLLGDVFTGELKLRLLIPFYWVCTARESFKGDEDIASEHIKNYGEHTENFLKIKKCVENDEQLPERTVVSYRGELWKFLKDFEIGRPEMVAKVNKEEKEEREKEKERKEDKKMSWINIGVVIVAAIVGAAIGSFLTYLLCRPTQPEPTVSEAQLQSEANNPTP